MYIEEKLDLILAKLNTSGPVSTQIQTVNHLRDLMRAIKQGDLIFAIKAYRSLTGRGLKEAKDAVEEFWPHPSKYPYSTVPERDNY